MKNKFTFFAINQRNKYRKKSLIVLRMADALKIQQSDKQHFSDELQVSKNDKRHNFTEIMLS